jgi:translocator protein
MATQTYSSSYEPASRRGHLVPSWVALPGFVLMCNVAGFVGNMVGGQDLYQRLALPSWAPPSQVFGPVWISLYVLTGTATWLVWRTRPDRDRAEAMSWFAIQLLLNAAWTPVFFGLQRIGAALALIIALEITVTGMLLAYARRSRLAAALLVPLWLWVGFAAVLNASIWWLNR